jgi:hypothetical protein
MVKSLEFVESVPIALETRKSYEVGTPENSKSYVANDI